jgi:DNA polymerase-3 subunit delta
LSANAQTVKQNNLLEGYQLERWIIKEVNKQHKKIDNDAVQELIIFIGNDLWKLSREIEKLISYTDTENIIIQDIRDIVCGRVNANMFEMIEAIALENTSIAITLFRKQIIVGDDIFHIFSMYAYQVRLLLNVSSAMNEGILNKDDIANILKVHPFVVQKTMNMLQKLSYNKIVNMHHNLTKIDFESKIGNYDMEPALELFIINK